MDRQVALEIDLKDQQGAIEEETHLNLEAIGNNWIQRDISDCKFFLFMVSTEHLPF